VHGSGGRHEEGWCLSDWPEKQSACLYEYFMSHAPGRTVGECYNVTHRETQKGEQASDFVVN
jgi:hypothetical protein